MRIESILKLVKQLNKDLNSDNDAHEISQQSCSILKSFWSTDITRIKANNKDSIHCDFKISVKKTEENSLKPNLYKIHENIYDIFASMNYALPILQGSAADNTFEPGWSDIDLLILIDRPCTFNEFKILRQAVKCCSNYIKKIQPLQHHGIFILPKALLKCYPESFMPPQALYQSVSNKEFELDFQAYLQPAVFVKTLSDRLVYIEEALETRYYYHHCYKSKPLALNNPEDCPYQVFAYINYLFLVPSIFKSSTGNSQYKGYTLRNLGELNLSEPIVRFIDKLNHFRDRWIEIGNRSNILAEPLDQTLVKWLNYEFWNEACLYERYFLERTRESIAGIN